MDTETWKPANYTYCDSHLKEDRRSGEDGRETRRALRSPFTFPRRVHFDVASLSFHFHADFPSKSHQKNTTGEQGQGSRGLFTPIPTLQTDRAYARKHIRNETTRCPGWTRLLTQVQGEPVQPPPPPPRAPPPAPPLPLPPPPPPPSSYENKIRAQAHTTRL